MNLLNNMLYGIKQLFLSSLILVFGFEIRDCKDNP